jgi:hypothetical protein
MSNQASADLDETPHHGLGQAEAGADTAAGEWEGRESDPSSATPPAYAADDPSSAGPGRETGADEQDDMDAMDDMDAYWASVEALDLDNLPPDEEEIPAAATAAEQDPAAAAEEQDDEDEDATATADGKPPQFRFRPRTDLESRTFALMKADKSLDLEGAMALARASLGLAAPADGSQDADEAAADDEAPEADYGVEQIEARIRELRREALAAKREYDADREADIEEQMLALEEQLPAAREREAGRLRLEAEAESAWEQTAQASWEAAQADYPQAADRNSAFAIRMREIDEAWEEAGDPRFDNADKARVISAIVAKELGVRAASAAPAVPKGRSLPAPASSRPSPFVSRPGPAAVRPASGSARTAADAPSQIDLALNRVDSLEAYEALLPQILAATGS